tara:strand:- start:6040 stop:10392 length:4353 start_codon:yes stop_codon:yes gene_type:complete
MKRHGILLLASLVLAVACPTQAAEQRKPNFIIVFCDNLGYGDIEPFGSTLHRTPNLNRMAKEGRKFTHFCATAGVCTPSRASIMTGCYSQRVGLHFNERDNWVLRPLSPYGLNPDEVTIAEVLKDEGYATAIVGKWHLGDQPEFLPTRQGFDWFFGVPYSDDMTARTWQDGSVWPPLPLMENEKVIEAPCDRDGLTKRYTERAMQWIAEHKDEPFFLYFPQAMPGSTKTPFSSEQFKGKSKNGPWGDSVEELDWSMGVMLDQLQELGIAEDTFVIWTSDNGAPIDRDRENLSRGSNRPLHGRGYTTAEGAFRVPAIVWQPGKVPAGTVCEELATTMDLLPTFANLAGGQPPADRKIDGHDITPLLYGEPQAKTPYEAFYYYDLKQLQAVRSGPWKLFLPVQNVRHPHFSRSLPPQNLLFNVVEDVACEHNVADQHPDVVARLTRLAEKGKAELGDGERRGSGQRERGKIPEGTKPVPQVMQAKALDVIEGGRHGRHWDDNDEMEPASSPEDSLAALTIEPGFEVQLFASEPLVIDPVAITFDEKGQMFVVEYRDYAMGPPAGEPPLSQVVMLEDTDGDGKADKRHMFADKLDFAHSIMAYRGGVIVGAKTKVLYLKDTDGDHIADVRETLFDGFKPAHAQMQIGCPRWGIDNWVYLNYGPGEVTSANNPDSPVELPRKDFRFNPKTMAFESDSGLGQYGNTVDRWGNRFYCTNRNPIMTTFLPPNVLDRNPFHTVSAAHYDVAPSGGDTKVYPLAVMRSNYLSHVGTHTSACGTTAYLGDLQSEAGLGKGLSDSVFVCEPIGHLVTRSVIQPDGVKLKAERAQPKSDFIASKDTWFRPASLATAPDGTMYLADMYRKLVEHPKFFPPEIVEKYDWKAGDDMGRIYRIVPKGSKPRAFQPPETVDDYVSLLADPNGWRQFLGQRLLIENDAKNAALKIRKLLDHPAATTRLHAMWTLDGLERLRNKDIIACLKDNNHAVRIDALKLAHGRMNLAAIFKAVANLADDSDVRVRYQVALTLSGSESEQAKTLLAKIALRDASDAAFAEGLLTSAKTCSGTILRHLVQSESFVAVGNAERIGLVSRLASIVGARGDQDELDDLLRLLDEKAGENGWWRAAAISGLGQGLPRYRGELGKLTLAGLASNPPKSLAESAKVLDGVFEEHNAIALDRDHNIVDRAAAAELLSYRSFAQIKDTLSELLASDQPVEIQTAAMQALARNGTEDASVVAIERWSELGPAVRGMALDLILRRVSSIHLALAAMESGQINKSALSIDQRVRLLKHTDKQIKAKASALFGGAVSSNRQKVAKEYEKSLTLTGSVAEGQKVFTRICAACHRVDGVGHDAGPDLTDTRNRSKPALLYDILDPNSKVEPRFTAYSVLTADGQLYNGLIVSETSEAVVLKMAEGKQQTIGRAEIDQIKVSDVSLMPEGIEKDVTPQQMADLLVFLKERG